MQVNGFTFARQLTEEILIFFANKKINTTEKKLLSLLKNLSAQNKDVIESSGILIRNQKYPDPFLVNQEIYLEFKPGLPETIKNNFIQTHNLRVIHINTIKNYKYLVESK